MPCLGFLFRCYSDPLSADQAAGDLGDPFGPWTGSSGSCPHLRRSYLTLLHCSAFLRSRSSSAIGLHRRQGLAERLWRRPSDNPYTTDRYRPYRVPHFQAFQSWHRDDPLVAMAPIIECSNLAHICGRRWPEAHASVIAAMRFVRVSGVRADASQRRTLRR